MFLYIHGLKRYVLDGEKNDAIQSPSMYNHLLWPTTHQRASLEISH